MAANGVKIDELSAAERKLVERCIEFQMKAVKRAQTAERNDAVAELRGKEYDELAALMRRFH